MISEEQKGTPTLIGVLTPDSLRLDGLRLILEADGKYQVISLAGSEENRPDFLCVVILDIGFAIDLDSCIRQLTHGGPQVSILVIGPQLDPEGIMQVVQCGAGGYLPYNVSEQEFRMALEVVQDGSVWAPRKVLAGLLAQKTREHALPVAVTKREEEVLQLLMQGYPNRQIAEALGLDQATVKAHISRLMRKLGVRNRVALSMHVISLRRPSI